MIDYSKYDNKMNEKELMRQIEDAKNNSPTEIPEGNYTVKLVQMEMTESKTGKLMIAARWKIVSGKYANRLIFQNQVVSGTNNDGFVIHKAMEFLRSIGVDEDECNFTNYATFGELVNSVGEDFKGEEYELSLSYSNGYPVYDFS